VKQLPGFKSLMNVPVFPHCYRIMLLRALDQHNVSHTQTHITLCPQFNCNVVSSHYLNHLIYLHISRAFKILTEDFRNYRLIYSQHSPWIYKHDFLSRTETGPPEFEPTSCIVNNMLICNSFSVQLATPGSLVQVNPQINSEVRHPRCVLQAS
jgi:hypothetical protein